MKTLLTNLIDFDTIAPHVYQALRTSDLGELFCEYRVTESLSLDQGIIQSSTYNVSHGFGLRSVIGETSSYCFSQDLSESTILKACENIVVNRHHQPVIELPSPLTSRASLYTADNPIGSYSLTDRVTLLQNIDAYARQKDHRVVQVSIQLIASYQAVSIMNAHGQAQHDFRPLIRLNISITIEHHQKRETVSKGIGGRTLYDPWVQPHAWQGCVDKALQQALMRLDAYPAPAGDMPVVLGPGWPGILLHEAVGHGLEGDANRKKSSVFSKKMGQRVASKGVTVIDDGTLADRRGSLNMDDEGVPTERTILIEDGVLVGFMQDQLNGRLMNTPSTGNGRRESFQHLPMPRMTNTFMLGGEAKLEDMIKSVTYGIFAADFADGQVDTASGQFVFSASEAYLIENGQLTAPLKGAMLIGNGPAAMSSIEMIGDDFAMDPGIGTCGKDGQQVPVGVGQPSLLLSSVTVGGRA